MDSSIERSRTCPGPLDRAVPDITRILLWSCCVFLSHESTEIERGIKPFCLTPVRCSVQVQEQMKDESCCNHCSLKRSQGLCHLLLCIFLHPVMSVEVQVFLVHKGLRHHPFCIFRHLFTSVEEMESRSQGLRLHFPASFFILLYRPRKKMFRSSSLSFCNLLMTDNSKRPRSFGTGPVHFLK